MSKQNLDSNNLQNNFSNALVAPSEMTFGFELDGVAYAATLYYEKLSLLMNGNAPSFSVEDFQEYWTELLLRRVEYVMKGSPKPSSVGKIWIPTMLEHILSYVGKGFNINYGVDYGWEVKHYVNKKARWSDDQIAKFSSRLSMYNKFTNDLVEYYNTDTRGSSDCLIIVKDNDTRVFVPMNMSAKNIPIAALLKQHLSIRDQAVEHNQCFRFIIGEQRAIVETFLRGAI